MAPIKEIEYFRVPPRWIFVKITDSDGKTGWGEASLEGNSEAVEGCLDTFRERFVGAEAKWVLSPSPLNLLGLTLPTQ
jgi:galactonate dehydratase